MSSRFDLLAQQIFQKDLIDCTIEELRQYADAHPYFAAAQFLLVKRLYLQQDPAFKMGFQKAALYYHQPVGFEAFLLASDEEPSLHYDMVETSVPATVEANVDMEQYPASEAAVMQSEENTAYASSIPEPFQPENETAQDALLFEPFHTVDYFASQGIKLSQEELPKDKFGKQLKSFTEWLKTMKKLPAGESAKNMDPQAEKGVESMAAHSVTTSEVVTETMAEIWIKQGQWEKAAEVYRKLSLLHPSKNAYFAAKLQNLKHNRI